MLSILEDENIREIRYNKATSLTVLNIPQKIDQKRDNIHRAKRNLNYSWLVIMDVAFYNVKIKNNVLKFNYFTI